MGVGEVKEDHIGGLPVNAIVTDARYRMSLAVIRALGQAGVRVVAQEAQANSPGEVLGFRSRHTAERILTASPATAPAAFVDDLLARASAGDVVIPMSAAAIDAIAARSDDVQRRLKVLLPPRETIRLANDKQRLLALAASIGIRTPRTVVAAAGESAESVLERAGLPAVIKYREGERLGLPADKRYAIVREPAQFLATYRAMAAQQEAPLVQEYIVGDGWGLSALLDRDSRPVATFGHRRLREYPVSGGPSCFARSIHDPHLTELGLRLLAALHWQGIAMVEFKRETATGEFVLMEVNPRFWGSLPLAIAAGVDFPTLLCRVAAGERVEPQTDYRDGTRMRYLFQDLLSVPGYLRRAPSRLGFLARFVGDLLDPRVVDGVFRWSDPLPGLAYLQRAIKKATRGGAGED